jgi:asparagine synthase (glutamine-hydrolysing)
MCGVNGIFAYHYAANSIARSELIRTRDHMMRRGPDGCGEWVSADERVGFGHRRLAIIDLSETGAQPMANADASLVVTFNGEIYNYRELRCELEAKGYAFRSQSDTEVLLHLYADRGEQMVHALRGMFAFAIWDRQRREVFLARDPYGIKPLYYSDDGWTFRFASQVKALLAGGAVSRDPEPAGLVGFYLWGSVPEPFTTYQSIRALPAGCTMRVDSIGARDPQRYHSIAAAYCEAEEQALCAPAQSPKDASSAVRAALLDSVQRHLVADVPVGAFLSAGVDSGALVGLMRDAGQCDIQTVTLAFDEYRGHHDDEAPLAEAVARHYGTTHTTRVVTQREFEADLPRVLEAMDQPTIDGLNTWFVSKAARELGIKVAISGLGGDELFGGYPSFRDVPKWASLMRLPSLIPGLGTLARHATKPLLRGLRLHPKAAAVLQLGGTYEGAYLARRGVFMPWELGDVLDRDTARIGLRRLDVMRRTREAVTPTPLAPGAKVATLEASLYMRNQLLRDTDWASMDHSLEVRTPLVDHALLAHVASLKSASSQSVGKDALAAAPTVALPRRVTEKAKTGFTTPIEAWMRDGTLGLAPTAQGKRVPWARRWSQIVFQHATAPA